ncbi:MAG: hypothetical protein WCH46_05100 [bacterium]
MAFLEVAVLVIALIALGSLLLGAIRNVRGPRKGSYRTSWWGRK